MSIADGVMLGLTDGSYRGPTTGLVPVRVGPGSTYTFTPLPIVGTNDNPNVYIAQSGNNNQTSQQNTENSTEPSNSADSEGQGNAESINWKGFSNGKLKSHYDKHVVDGNEFGDISQNEYLKKAKEFAAESNPSFQETKVGNFNIKYDPETRRVFIGHEKSREIRTFYKADSRDADPFQAAIELAKELSGK
jgi:hypothetical protein